jgi:hypothetical protein
MIKILNVTNECFQYSDCGSPLNVTNGNLLYIATTFGSTASLVCDRGYDGNGTISCLDTGSWESPPKCSIKGQLLFDSILLFFKILRTFVNSFIVHIFNYNVSLGVNNL